MSTVYYITHPEVVVDAEVPIPQWDLSETGHHRLRILLTQPWVQSIGAVFCSSEQKAKTTALAIASQLGLKAVILEELGEIDRSSTGYLPPAELNPVVKAFFARPEESIRGWERAIDAQRRILSALKTVLCMAPPSTNLVIVGHGGVGTLLLNHLKGSQINRKDAAPGQGYYFAFDRESQKLLHSWREIDQLANNPAT